MFDTELYAIYQSLTDTRDELDECYRKSCARYERIITPPVSDEIVAQADDLMQRTTIEYRDIRAGLVVRIDRVYDAMNLPV